MVELTDSNEASVIGAVYWLWSTADQHTEDGYMPGLTLKQIDRKTGVPRIGAALASVGWIIAHDDGVTLVRFEEHNGESAKKRCQTAKRVAKHRSANADVTQPELQDEHKSVTPALAREEKRRVIHNSGSNEPSLLSAKPPKARKKPPDDFEVTPEMAAWAATEAQGVDLRLETARFRDHTFATARTDWPGTWRNWMRKAAEVPQRRANAPPRASEPEWRTEQRTRTQAFAGPAAAKPVQQTVFSESIDVPARILG